MKKAKQTNSSLFIRLSEYKLRILRYVISVITDCQAVDTAVAEIVNEQVYGYENLLNAYTATHVRLLKAIAKEGIVKEINASTFISKYQLKAASSVNTALQKLIDKELVYRTANGYSIYDRLMAIWLKKL